MTSDTDPNDGMPSRARLARECLLFRMRQLSETFYSAGWIEDLEFEVWDMAHRSPYRFAGNDVTDNTAKFFRDLATLAEGWWVPEDDTRPDEPGPVFISMERWQEILGNRTS